MIFPQAFIERTTDLLKGESSLLFDTLSSDSPTSIRLNQEKTKNTLSAEKVAWCNAAYYLPKRPIFTLDPLFHAGAYYVQEASSMFLEQVLKQYIDSTSVVLDLCAAPGGKSTHLISLLPEGSLLVSNEIVRSRAYILAENITKWGNPNTLVANNTPADWGRCSAFFDAIVVDAPCSGEGMFRKDPKSISEWTLQNVQKCSVRQREILCDAWAALKTDGILIYSTCTYNREENEEIVDFVVNDLGAEFLPVSINPTWNIVETDLGYRFFPHKTKGEGFFISILRKKGIEYSHKMRIKKLTQIFPKEMDFLSAIVSNIQDYKLVERRGKQFLLPRDNADSMLYLMEQMNVLQAGVLVGEWKGKCLVPDAGLALSSKLELENCERADLDLLSALTFLRSENIYLPHLPKGFILVTYKGFALGWVKNIGNRCNSLHPSEWRIRMKIPLNTESERWDLGEELFTE